MKTTALLLALLCTGSAGFAQQAKPAAKAPAAAGTGKAATAGAEDAPGKAPILACLAKAEPFATAEEAWFWTMAALIARRDGARGGAVVAGRHAARGAGGAGGV